MQGIKDLLGSERGMITLVLIALVTILTVLKIISGADWLSYTKWLAVAIITAKTATGVMDRVVETKTGQTPASS